MKCLDAATHPDFATLPLRSIAQSGEERGRIPQLDGLRGLAVLMVFVSHAYRSQLLWSGVDLFFVLSGFLITGILLEQRTRHTLSGYLAAFYKRRARRILPPYILLLCLVSVLFGVGWIRHWYLFLFLMNTDSFFRIVRPFPLVILWSLAVEEQFYLIWPLAVYFLSEKALAWLAGFVLIAAPLLRYIATAAFPGHWQIYTLTVFRMDMLAAGALAALGWRHYHDFIQRVGIYGLFLAGLMAVPLIDLSRFSWFRPTANTIASSIWLYEMILIAYAGVLLWALSGRAVQLLRLPPLMFVGRISYTFYLVHTTSLMVVRGHVHHYSVGNAIAFTAAMLYSMFSWYFLERPILQTRHPSRVTCAAVG